MYSPQDNIEDALHAVSFGARVTPRGRHPGFSGAQSQPHAVAYLTFFTSTLIALRALKFELFRSPRCHGKYLSTCTFTAAVCLPALHTWSTHPCMYSNMYCDIFNVSLIVPRIMRYNIPGGQSSNNFARSLPSFWVCLLRQHKSGHGQPLQHGYRCGHTLV